MEMESLISLEEILGPFEVPLREIFIAFQFWVGAKNRVGIWALFLFLRVVFSLDVCVNLEYVVKNFVIDSCVAHAASIKDTLLIFEESLYHFIHEIDAIVKNVGFRS